MADKKNIIDHKRIRKISGSFSWVDHRLITAGFLDELTTLEILLYFFLMTVSDRYGLSFYHDDRICRLLKIDLSGLGGARKGLIQRALIAYKFPIYQVLALPQKPVAAPTEDELWQEKKNRGLFYINRIKQIASGGGR